MSQENVELVRNAYMANNKGDREAALRSADPDIVIDATRRLLNPTTYVGIDDARQWFADMDEVWERFGLEVDELIDAGDRVVALGRLTGKGKASGVEVEQPIADVWTVRDSRIVRGEIGYTSRQEALEAAGLSE
jgi:uncharacterized protein